MATPTTREELKQYALRKLGAPVIEINVDDSQLEDSIDDALQMFNEYHFDGVERVLFKYEVTADDITNGFIDTDSIGLTGPNDYPQVENGTKLLSVTKVFSLMKVLLAQTCLAFATKWHCKMFTVCVQWVI